MDDSDWNPENFLSESQSDSNFEEGAIATTTDPDEDFVIDGDEDAEDGADISDVDAKPRRSTRQAVPKAPSTHEYTGSPELLEDDADDWKPPERKKRRKGPVSSATRRRRNAARRRAEPSNPAGGSGTGTKRGRPRRKPPTPVHIPTEGEFDLIDEDKTPSPPPPPPPPPKKARKPARKKGSSPAQAASTSPVISAASLRPRKTTATSTTMKVYINPSSEKMESTKPLDLPSTSEAFDPYSDLPSGIKFDPSELDGIICSTKEKRFAAFNDDDENIYEENEPMVVDENDAEVKDEEFDDHEVSPEARFAKRPSDSPDDGDDDYEPSEDGSELQLSYLKALEGGLEDDDDEDTRKFYEDLGLSDDMDAEVAAITGGKLLPSPTDDESVKSEKPEESVEIKSETPDSAISEYTTIEVTFRKLNIHGESVKVPELMLESEDIFKHVLSMDTFNSLSEESKAQLKRFLPRGVDPEQGVRDALTADSSFFFGSPLELARKRINEGYYDNNYPQHQAMLRDDRRVRYDHFIRQYHMRMLKKLMLMRHAILEQAATIPPDAAIRINPMKYANLAKLKKEKEIRERASIRADMLINSVCGTSSPEESADEQPYEPPIPQQPEGRSVHYSNSYGEHDLDMYQPHKIRSIKEMLRDYKNLKRKNPDCPSLDTSDITLEKVYERSGLSFQSERNFAQNPYPAPTATTKRRRKRKLPQESEVDGDSAPPSPSPSEIHA